MAWNDPFENLVETIVDELGIFLQNKGELAVHEIARTQEVCRDFCNFLCKDIHKATKSDFALYLQFHAMTPQDEADYSAILANIRDFCDNGSAPRTPPASSAKPTPLHSASGLIAVGLKSPSSVALTEDELRQTANATPQHAVESVDFNEQTFLPMKNMKGGNSGSYDFSMANALEEQIQMARKNKTSQPEEKIQTTKKIKITPPDKSHFEYDLSNELGNIQSQPDNEPAPSTSSTLMGCESPISEESFRIPSQKRKLLVQRKEEPLPAYNDESLFPPSSMSEPEPEADEPVELIRSVNSIAYKFNQDGLRKMREFEKQKMKAEVKASSTKAINESLITGFHPYVFDKRYTIDMPLPKDSDMQPRKRDPLYDVIVPIAIPLTPILIGIILALLVPPVGAAIIIIGLILLLFFLPALLPPNQQTPQTTLQAYLNAKAGRCTGKATTVLARSNDDIEDLDLNDLWKPLPSWGKAIPRRFKSIPILEARTVCGSESQNALLLLHEYTDGQYWLIPMVRIKEKWYITDPTMAPHYIKR